MTFPFAHRARTARGRALHLALGLWLTCGTPPLQAGPATPVFPGHFYLDPLPGGPTADRETFQSLLDHELPGLVVSAVKPVGTLLDARRWSHGVDLSRLLRIEFEPGSVAQAADSLAGLLAGLPGVKRCEPVPLRSLSAWYPDDPGLTAQWHLKTVEATGAWQIRTGRPAAKGRR